MQTLFLKEKDLEKARASVPWTHWQFDNFFPPQEFKKFQPKLCSVETDFKSRIDDEADIRFMFLPDLELATFFLSPDFQLFLKNLTGENLEIYEKGLVQLRRMDSSSPAFPNHIDSQDQRSLVCLFYLSEDWSPERGGTLCLHQSEVPDPHHAHKVIEPLANRMVLFFSDENHWHSVDKVHNWSRYSIVSEWIVQKEC